MCVRVFNVMQVPAVFSSATRLAKGPKVRERGESYYHT